MTPISSPQPRPRPVSDADKKAFQDMIDASQAGVQATIAAWRNGLGALIALVTAGSIVTGRTATSTLTTPWRIAVTLAIGGGLVLAVVGLWYTLAAEVGTRVRLRTLDDIRSRYASVEAYKVGQAAAAGRRLSAARTAVAMALGLLLLGVVLTWWAPAAPAIPSAYIQVTSRGSTACGTLESADGGALRLSIVGQHSPAVIPLGSVQNLSVTGKCP